MNSHLFDFILFGNPVVVTPWKMVGLVGVGLFTARWVVQMYYSRKAGRPVTPRVFWVLSMVGSLMALAYFVFSPKQDMVGILGYLFPSLVAAYNLYLDLTHSQKAEAAARAAAAQAAAQTPAPTPAPTLESVSAP